MTISSISNILVYATQQTYQTNDINTNSDTGDYGTTQVSGDRHHHHHSHGNGLMQAVQQALSQMGLNLDSQSSSSSQSASGTDNTSSAVAAASATSTSESSRQALHAFMHDLFGAMRATQDQTSGTDSSTDSRTGGTSSMTAELQDVIQALGSSNTSSTQKSSLNNLQPDFNNLISTLGDSSSSNGAQSPDLQVFLQNLQQDLSNETGSYGKNQAGSIQSGYPTDLSSQLQDVIQALGASSSSDQSDDLNKLQSDYQNLVSSLSNRNSSNGIQSQDLQLFLQNLMQNLNGQPAPSTAVGSFLSTMA